MKIIKIEDVGEVELRKSKRAKRLIIKIDQVGKPIVTVPSYVPFVVAEQFVLKQKKWLLEHANKKQPLVLFEGKRIGKIHTIHFIKKAVIKPTSRILNDKIVINYPEFLTPISTLVQEEAKKACKRALKKQAELYLPGMLHQAAKKYGFTYSEVRIKTVKTRWGSCSSNRIINLSIWLMQLPQDLIEYVIFHELCHLKHMNHSKQFWTELERMVPAYKHLKKQLKEYSPTLI